MCQCYINQSMYLFHLLFPTDDDNRFVLDAMQGHESDYVNASYIDVS